MWSEIVGYRKYVCHSETEKARKLFRSTLVAVKIVIASEVEPSSIPFNGKGDEMLREPWVARIDISKQRPNQATIRKHDLHADDLARQIGDRNPFDRAYFGFIAAFIAHVLPYWVIAKILSAQ